MRFGSYEPRNTNPATHNARVSLLKNPLRKAAPTLTSSEPHAVRRGQVTKDPAATHDHLGHGLVSKEEPDNTRHRRRSMFSPLQNESMSGTLGSAIDSAAPAVPKSGVKTFPSAKTAQSKSYLDPTCSSSIANKMTATSHPRKKVEAPPFALDYPSARKKPPVPRTKKMFESKHPTNETTSNVVNERRKVFPNANQESEPAPPKQYPQPYPNQFKSTKELLRFKTGKTPRSGKTPRTGKTPRGPGPLAQRKINNILAWGTGKTPRPNGVSKSVTVTNKKHFQPTAAPPAPYDCSHSKSMFAPMSARKKSVHRSVQPASNLRTGLVPKSARGEKSRATAAASAPPKPRVAQQSSLGLGSFQPKSARGQRVAQYRAGAGSRATASHHQQGSGVRQAMGL